MKKILCYGDSNTFGYAPDDGLRYDEKIRWTGILQSKLKNEYEILEEGACDRTGFVNNPKGFLFSAQRHFPKLISKIEKIDILVLAVGTNDLQFQYGISYGAVERGLETLILCAKPKVRKIILIPPVQLSEKVLEGNFNFQFDKMSIIKSKKVIKIYKSLSKIYSCLLFDFNDFVSPSDTDGLHYNSFAHKIIADKLYEFILKNAK